MTIFISWKCKQATISMLKISNNTTCNECVKTAVFQTKVTQTKGDVFLNAKKQKFVKKNGVL
ncbi:MAG: hypothetical protein DRJ07_11730 [Bacteroidetes bacterium]|nr:MAG: hypothetical protein DRJ07_11730 [Bacteroidota bacterium]